MLATGAAAKDKKPAVPSYVLRAHTVAVMVDPAAGVSLNDPIGNQTAQKDVETALLNWGRFQPMMAAAQADLVIVIRKGHGKLVEETVDDPRQNSRAGVINPTDTGIGVGAQHGQQPGLSRGGPPDGGQAGIGRTGPPQTRTEIGGVDDEFVVYEGGVDHPMDGVPGWRWVRKDGLRAHDVPAVEEFRKAVAEAEKAAAQQSAKKP